MSPLSLPSKTSESFRWFHSEYFLIVVLILGLSFSGFAQKNKDIIPVVECVKLLKNGVYQATFGYENPTKKEVVIDENGSIIKSNNGKKVAKGLNKFSPGRNSKTFTKEFGPGDFVLWTIVSNGNEHEVIANANSSKCLPDDGFIEPIIGNGKSEGLSGNELLAFCEGVAGETPSSLIFQSKTDDGVLKVLVEIIPKPTFMDAVLQLLLTSPDFDIDNDDFLLDPAVYDYNTLTAIDVYMNKDNICNLNSYSEIINFARPVYPSTINSTGVVSQGDAAQTSNLVRESFRMKNSEGLIVPVDGDNITVGVMSDSYDKFNPGQAAIDVSNGELPDDVVVLEDNAFKASDEGRAMMQIVHDVAPGADLQFHTATASPRQFEVAYNALAETCDVIVDDITFITEPFFGSGRIAEAINSSGRMHVTAAGNIGNKAHQGEFNATPDTPPTNFLDPNGSTVAHDFDIDPNQVDYLQKISVVPGTYLIALQWMEDQASQNNNDGALKDLDIYIVDDQGRLLVGSNRVNVLGDPTEVIAFRATGTGEANIMITSANGPTNVPFRYIAFRTTAEDGTPDGLKIVDFFGVGAPTVSGHAMNTGSVTVGAVDYRKAGDSPAEAEYFSSYAGELTDGITTLYIDQYAPDGVNTTVPTIGQPATCGTCDGDSFLNFYGTSAAAPHYAGAAALLLSAAQAWFPPVEQAGAQATSTISAKTSYAPGDAIKLFQDTGGSVDAPVGSEGRFLNTLEAFKSIAAQTAKITELRVEAGKTPSAEPFTVTIIGEFFPENIADVTIWLGNQTLEDVEFKTITEDGETIKVITATVPEFTANPGVVIEVKSKTEGGDGSGGDPAYFFDEGKIALNITAKSATFEYGQDIISTYYRADPSDPGYEQPFTVEGLPVGVTFADLQAQDNLPPIILGNQSVDDQLEDSGYPRATDYVITPSFGEEVLSDEQLEKYQINFKPGYLDPVLGKVGYLTITKKDLKISAEPVSITYGESVVVPLEYEYDMTGIADDGHFRAYISSAHDSDFFEENRLALINKYTAILAKYPGILSTLDGGSWIASEQTITNKFNAVLAKYPGILSDMGLINLDEEDFVNYYEANDAYGDGTIVSKYPGILSKFNAILSSEDLFRGNVTLYDPITNKLNAILAKYPAILATDDERPYASYESIFAIVSDEEPFSGEYDDDGLPIVEIPKLYALNLITGLDVTPEGESHSIYPGTFLNSVTNNFNISYEPGELFVSPATLNASTDDLTIPYGQTLTKDDLVTTFEGWAYDDPFQESEATVFPEEDGGIPYYFVKLNEDGSETDEVISDISALTNLGKYKIMIGNPRNYVIKYVNDSPGILTITEANLTFNPVAQTITYGENPVMDPLDISGFANEEEAIVLADDSGSIPYYFVREGDANEYTIEGELKMPVGVYDIFIKDDPADNYVIEHVEGRGQLTVVEAGLTFNPEAQTISYGDNPVMDPLAISGFTEGEGPEALYDESGQIPYYFTKEGDTKVYTIGGEAKMGIGVYDIFITDDSSDNYVIGLAEGRGQLNVVPRVVNVSTENLNETYGYLLGRDDLTTIFDSFAYEELSTDVFGPSGIPYYFVDGDQEFELGALLEVGTYDIRVRETNANYVFEFSDGNNSLEITRATLIAQIDDLFINQGDVPEFSISTIEGFIAGEDESTVYRDGVPYYFVDENGVEASNTDVGAFTIRIRDDRKNYAIVTNDDATLYINPYNDDIRKVRTYSDCVDYDDITGLYTVTFRYENDNWDPVFVPQGPDNFLFGDGYIGNNADLPTVFMPGSGVFEVEFNGGKLVWSLTTYEGTQKSGVSSATTSDSGECDAKLDGFYLVYPNPVTQFVNIEQTISEQSDVYILNMYGIVVSEVYRFNGDQDVITIDMQRYATGIYIVRIVSSSEVRTINIIKE